MKADNYFGEMKKLQKLSPDRKFRGQHKNFIKQALLQDQLETAEDQKDDYDYLNDIGFFHDWKDQTAEERYEQERSQFEYDCRYNDDYMDDLMASSYDERDFYMDVDHHESY